MKRLTALLLILVLTVSMTACSGTPAIRDLCWTPDADPSRVKTHGQTMLSAEGLHCDFSASGLEFHAYIEGSLSVTVEASALCYFALYIDGVRSPGQIQVLPGTQTLLLADFPQGGSHTIKLLKLTESLLALCTVREIAFRGYFLDTPPEKELYIQFIGDSITAGYGNLGDNDTPDPGSARNQDATLAYAFLTAQALDADYSILCCSGMGLVTGYVDYTAREFLSAASYHRDPEAPAVPGRIPDLIVINLGTNDQSKGSHDEDLAEAVPALIGMLQDFYGRTIPVIWVHGMMGAGKWSCIDEALAELNRRENAYIRTLELPKNSQGGGYHPSREAQEEAAELLTAFIQNTYTIRKEETAAARFAVSSFFTGYQSKDSMATNAVPVRSVMPQ